MSPRIAQIVRPRALGGLMPAVAALRIAAGVVLVLFSAGKFVHHGAEAAAFDRYGIPFPEVATGLVGLLELGGGLLLVAGLLTRPVALLLAGNMLGAVLTAGRIDGGAVHLGLAPALLAVMVLLVWAGAGRPSADALLSRAASGRPAAPTGSASSPRAPRGAPAR